MFKRKTSCAGVVIHLCLMDILFLYSMDASKEDGSLGRLVNDEHKGPTCKIKTIELNQQPHLCIFAVWDIKPGEEISYSYGDSDWPWRAKVLKCWKTSYGNIFIPCYSLTIFLYCVLIFLWIRSQNPVSAVWVHRKRYVYLKQTQKKDTNCTFPLSGMVRYSTVQFRKG